MLFSPADSPHQHHEGELSSSAPASPPNAATSRMLGQLFCSKALGGQLTSISVSSTSSIVLPNHGAGPNLETTATCEELELLFCPHIFGAKSPMPSPSWPALMSFQGEVQALLSQDLEPVRVRAMSPALMTPGISLLATAGSKTEKVESITHAPMASHTSGVAQALSCSCSQGTLTCHHYCASKMR